MHFNKELIRIINKLFLQERCGFKTTGDRTQVYKLDPHRHGEVALAGTGEMPIAGTGLS